MSIILNKRNLFAFFLSFSAGSAHSQTFGTKFACCSIENTSTLGGGSCTLYKPTLRDRALTQVDAQVRCGTQKMVWATHQCPAPSGNCSSDSAPKTCSGYVNIFNSTNGSISFNLQSNNSWRVVSIAPGEQKSLYVVTNPSSTGSCEGAYTQVSHDWLYEAGTQPTYTSVFLGGSSTFDYWREGQTSTTDRDPNKTIIGTRLYNN